MIQLGSAYGEIQIGTEGAERNIASLSTTMRNIGATMSLGISAPLGLIGKQGLMAAADFEESLNVMQVILGATTDQMAGMQAQALRLGADTVFSAGEAAEAMLELAKAGMDVEQTQAAIAGVLDLAAAGELGLAQAAEIAANAVNAFGLEASDSDRVANMLAAAANASSVEVKDLADSMKMSSAVMSSYGQSIESTTTALALLGNAGLKGSDAGTSLKQMMLSLAAPTDRAAKLMSQLGIEVYDAQGNMREFPDILASLEQAMFDVNQATVIMGGRTGEQEEELKRLQAMYKRTQASISDYSSGVKGAGMTEEARQKKLASLNSELATQQAQIQALLGIQGEAVTVSGRLTEEQRNAALAMIFGSDAVRAANILLKEGTEAWDDMAVAVTKEGAASEVATARMKGLSGAIEQFQGEVESMLIDAFLPFLDSLSDGIRWLADLVTMFTTLPQPVKNAALAFLAVLAAAGPVMLAISGTIALLGALLSPIGLVTLAIAGLAAAFSADFLGIRTVVTNSIDGIVAAFRGFAESIREKINIPAITEQIKLAFGALVTFDLASIDLGKLQTAVTSAISGIDWSSLRTNAEATFASLRAQVMSALSEIDWAGAQATATTTLTGLRTAVWNAIGAIDWSALTTGAASLYTGLRSAVTTSLGAIDWSVLSTNVTAMWGTLKSAISDAFPAADTWLQSDALTKLRSVVDALYGEDGILRKANDMLTGFVNAANAQLENIDATKLGENFSTIVGAVLGIASQIATASIEGTGERIKALIGLATSITTFLTNFATGLDVTQIATAISGFAAAFSEQLKTTLGDANLMGIGTALGGVATTLVTKLGELLSAPEFATNLGQTLGNATSALATGALEIVTGFANELAKIDWNNFKAQLSTFVTDFLTGFASGLADANWSVVADAFARAVGEAIYNFLTTNPFEDLLRGFDERFNPGSSAPWWEPEAPEFEWPEYEPYEWPEYDPFEWPDYTDFVWPDYIEWAWPEYQTWKWPDYTQWVWPDYIRWEWPDYIAWAWPTYPTWSWPRIPTPDWLSSLLNWRPSLPSWLGGDSGTVIPSSFVAPAAVQPASRMAGAGAGGNIYVTVEVDSINSALDLEHVAAVVASRIRYRQS